MIVSGRVHALRPRWSGFNSCLFLALVRLLFFVVNVEVVLVDVVDDPVWNIIANTLASLSKQPNFS